MELSYISYIAPCNGLEMLVPIIVGEIVIVLAIIITLLLRKTSKKNHLLLQADDALRNHRFQETYNIAQKVLKIDNYNCCAKYYAGEACFGMGNCKEGERLFKTALYSIQSNNEQYRPIIYRKLADYHFDI